MVDFFAFLKDIFGDLNCAFYPLDCQLVLAKLLQTNSAIHDGIDQSSIIHIFLPDLNTSFILSVRLFIHFALVKIVRVKKNGCAVLDEAVVFFYEIQVFFKHLLRVFM